ncbi:LacI family transcriptional regulator [Clostridiales bacterium COT073_COT-073]|nr:LacI family transcriptional regulator [Clostridiales bacterium COT073_COT-073]
MITINDIATLAGVSKSTVSRVLTNRGYVNEETRKRINAVIRESGYQPSESARNLSKKETNTIGVIVPEIGNSFYSEVLQGISEIIDENDLTIIYCNTDNDAVKEEKALQMMKRQRVRGIVLAPAIDYAEKSEVTENLRRLLDKLNAPVVLLDRDVENSGLDKVMYDNSGSGYRATKELIEAGNDRIGIITGNLELKIARDRYDGYCKAMKEYNMPILKKDIFHGDFTIQTAYKISKKIFMKKDRPRAFLTCNNMTTLGFLRAVREKNMKLGREIAMIGIDHVDVLDIIDYKYSYVTRDTVEMGRKTMRLLINRISDPKIQQQTCIMPYQLVLKGAEFCELI